MEMRLNAEVVKNYGVKIKSLVATGGGANSSKWLQIKADIQGIPVQVLRSSEGGLCGCAMLQAVALGDAKDLAEAKKIFVRYVGEHQPKNTSVYEAQYERYQKIYNTIKELY